MWDSLSTVGYLRYGCLDFIRLDLHHRTTAPRGGQLTFCLFRHVPMPPRVLLVPRITGQDGPGLGFGLRQHAYLTVIMGESLNKSDVHRCSVP